MRLRDLLEEAGMPTWMVTAPNPLADKMDIELCDAYGEPVTDVFLYDGKLHICDRG